MQLDRIGPKAYKKRSWQPLYGSCLIMEHSPQPRCNQLRVDFGEGGKPEYQEKNPVSPVEIDLNSAHILLQKWEALRKNSTPA